jgi:hypothetical protein
MQVLVSLRTNNHNYRQLTVNDLTEWEPFSRYKFGRNTIKLKNVRLQTS